MKRNNNFERQLHMNSEEAHAYFNLVDAYYLAKEDSPDQHAIGMSLARMVSIFMVRQEMEQARNNEVP